MKTEYIIKVSFDFNEEGIIGTETCYYRKKEAEAACELACEIAKQLSKTGGIKMVEVCFKKYSCLPHKSYVVYSSFIKGEHYSSIRIKNIAREGECEDDEDDEEEEKDE